MFTQPRWMLFWFTVFLAIGAPLHAHDRIGANPGFLDSLNTSITPPFLVAGQTSEVSFSVEIADKSLRFSEPLILEQQKLLPNGRAIFVPIALLRDDAKGSGNCNASHHHKKPRENCPSGRHGRPNDRDGIFTGTAKFQESVSGTVYVRARGVETCQHKTLVSALFPLAVQHACGPTGNVLPVSIIEAGGSKPQSRLIEFEVPRAGGAILRLVNGARVGAPMAERISGASIVVNAQRIAVINKGSNVSEIPVRLNAGGNRLELTAVKAPPGSRLSARIDTCSDTLELQPVLDTQAVGTTLTVRAALRGLGLPIADVPIAFSVSGIGDVSTPPVSTDAAGFATATLTPFTAAGTGVLTASTQTVTPALSDAISLEVVAAPSIGIRKSNSEIIVKSEETGRISFFADLFKADNQAYQADFVQFIAPDNDGVTLTPATSQTVVFSAPLPGNEAKPRIREIPVDFTGVTPGRYKVTSRLTLAGSGETASTDVDVEVSPARDVLTLARPNIVPGAIPVNAPTTVLFQAAAGGVAVLPDTLALQKCNPAESACTNTLADPGWETVGQLFNGDNGIYTAEIPVSASGEGQLLYRATGQGGLSLTPSLSDVNILQVSRFPNGPNTTAAEILENQATGEIWVAENVLVSFLPGTSPARIEDIVAQAGRAAGGQPGAIVGQIPEIGIFQVELSVNTGLSDQQRIDLINSAISIFKNYDEVRQAGPNIAGFPAGQADDGGIKQWGAPRIHALEAWDALTGTLPGSDSQGTAVGVAVVDSGVYVSHSDLTGQIALGSGNSEHATGVAAIIAAKQGNGGISGIAYGAKIYSYGSNDNLLTRIAGVIDAANQANVKVINLSWEQYTNENSDLKCAMRYAAFSSATPISTPDLDCRPMLTALNIPVASTGHDKLIVAAAGNGYEPPNPVNTPRNIVDHAVATSGSGATQTYHRYPCSWSDLVVCVGNSTVSDPTAVSTAPPQPATTDILHTASQTWPSTAGDPSNGCGIRNPSNFGPAVDIYAPGTCIYTATASANGYARQTGTSFAAPQVAGAAAVLWGELGLTSSAQSIVNQLTRCTSTSTNRNVEEKPSLDLFLAASQKAHVNLVRGESDFKSLFGVYNTLTGRGRILFNIQTPGGLQTATFNLLKTLYLENRQNVGYFFIPNGANLNQRTGDQTSNLDPYVEADLVVEPVQAGSNIFCVKQAGVCLNGEGNFAYFSEQGKNADGAVHVVSDRISKTPFDVSRGGSQFWEDLPFQNSDLDYNDAEINITFDRFCQ